MSHFLVVALLRPATVDKDEAVQRLLAPFHEFECTGVDDKFVKTIDITAAQREDWQTTENDRLRAPDGTLHEPWDAQFYRDPTDDEVKKIGPLSGTGCGNGMSWATRDWGDGKGYRPKVQFIPEGWSEVKVPLRDTMTFRQYVEEYHGTKVVPFGESPNTEDEHKYGYATLTEAGEINQVFDRTNPNAKWDWFVIGGRWDRCLLGDDARHRGVNQPYDGDPSTYGNIVPVAELPPDFSSFAVLTPEGEWIERGKMGWWACVSDAKDEDKWKAEQKAIFEKYRDCIAVAVDCHI